VRAPRLRFPIILTSAFDKKLERCALPERKRILEHRNSGTPPSYLLTDFLTANESAVILRAALGCLKAGS